MANKNGVFPEVQGDTVPATIVSEWQDGVRKSFQAGGKFNTRIFLDQGTKVDWDQKVGIPAADNFIGVLGAAGNVLPNGITAAVAEMFHRANLLTRGFRKWERAIRDYLELIEEFPAALDRTIAKGTVNLVELLPTLASVGVRSLGIPGIANAATFFLADDRRWKTRAPAGHSILTDDQDSCYLATLRRTANAAMTGLATQGVVIAKNAMRASINGTILATFLTEQNARQVTAASGFAAAGVTIGTYDLETDPQLQLHVICTGPTPE